MVLHTLFILKKDIKGIDISATTVKRLVFHYRVEADSLTMDGWRYSASGKEPETGTQPALKLTQCIEGPDMITLRDGMCLSSLVLYKDDLREVFRAIKPDTVQSLVFVPKTEASADDKFIWEMYASKQPAWPFFLSAEIKALAIISASLNPSPPRTFSKAST